MNVLLINSDFSNVSFYTDAAIMPLTMYHLGAFLRNDGHTIKIMDPILYRVGFYKQTFLDELLGEADKFDVIAFSANSFSWSLTLYYIKCLRKKNYKGKIIVGGIHPTLMTENVFENDYIDYAMVGEGEISFPKLINAISGRGEISEISGLAYISDGKLITNVPGDLIDFKNDWPLPAYDLVPKGAYSIFTIESSRGCYGNCTFCSILYKKCWRGYDPDIFLDRLNAATDIMDDKINGKMICFTDDCFTSNLERAKIILEKMSYTKFRNYAFIIESRLKQLIDIEFLSILKKFPSIKVQVGIESGYDAGLLNIRKGIRYDDIEKGAKLIHEYGLSANVLFSFIVGFPNESEKEVMETLRTVSYIKDKYNVETNCIWWLPLPSVEFTRLKKIATNINDNLFNDIDWQNNNELFFQTHPFINTEQFATIQEKIELSDDIGVSLRTKP